MSDAERVLAASRELYLLRRSHEEIQNKFFALEAYVSRRSDQPFELMFANEPVQDAALEVGRTRLPGIRQILPVSSTGFLAFALHLSSVGTRASSIRLILRSVENAEIVGVWTKSSKDLSVGWNTFGLPRGLAGIRRTLQLEVCFETEEEGLQLSTGPMQPLVRYQVSELSTSKPIAPRSLALKVWAGLPGVRIPDAPHIWAADSTPAPTGPREVALLPEIIARVTWGNRDAAQFEASPVSLVADQGAISCHPPRFGSTVAMLAAALPPDAVGVSAKVHIAHSQSDEVSFALAVARPSSDLDIASLLMEGENGEMVCSEWVTIRPDAPGKVTLFLEKGYSTGWRDIQLLTRMAVGGKNDFAWARFSALAIMVDDA